MPEQPSNLPLHMLQSGQLHMLSPVCDGWLILRKPFHADIVGPGAVVGGSFDIQCQSIYAIGDVQFISLGDEEQRRAAYQKRVSYIQTMQAIVLESAPLKRASDLLEQLITWVGLEQAEEIPHALLSALGGVMPHNIDLAWRARTTALPTHHGMANLRA